MVPIFLFTYAAYDNSTDIHVIALLADTLLMYHVIIYVQLISAYISNSNTF